MEKFTLYVVGALAIFQATLAESQLDIPSVESSELSDRAELQIINLCTEVPTYYERILNSYTNAQSSSTEGLQNIKDIKAKLKQKAGELKQYVSEYDDRVSSTDPDAQTIQNLMSEAVNELVQSVDEINEDFNEQTSQAADATANVSSQDRVEAFKKHVRPAMVKFEESCLLQTKDILKNVLKDYEDSLLSR